MKSVEDFIQHLKERGKTTEIQDLAEEVIFRFLEAYQPKDSFLREYCDLHIAGKADAVNQIVILAWYHDFIQDKSSVTYLITLLGTIGVLENQEKRMRELFGDVLTARVYEVIQMPKLGSDLAKYPLAISEYLTKMQEVLALADCKKVLAGNHHEVNVENFTEDKRRWKESKNFEEFLADKHARLVAKLDDHAKTGKLWFEQYITDDVVDYVSQHQEIQTGVFDGKQIIVDKIPYNPDAWLKEQDPKLKRYHACHCPFVRNAILQDIPVNDLWCYCSGGFTKLFFDFIFDRELEVQLLESVLSGGDRCRFTIKIPEDILL